jgi:hypothetical protein|tara:strand:+ start:151 stop:393 length:243 start_codon:yes stop_codon:yes gene_type:complete
LALFLSGKTAMTLDNKVKNEESNIKICIECNRYSEIFADDICFDCYSIMDDIDFELRKTKKKKKTEKVWMDPYGNYHTNK